MRAFPERDNSHAECVRTKCSRIPQAYESLQAMNVAPPTSVMPYQLMMAATDSSSLPWHWRSSPADAGIMPVVSARCPPAELPVVTMRGVVA